jgi:acyl carrier protein
MKETIFAYVRENTFKNVDEITPDTKLFVEGIFDSMGFVLLLDFLEEKFNVVANDEDLIEENFESINSIINFLERKSATPVQQE